MSTDKKTVTTEDRLIVFIHASYALALQALGLAEKVIAETALTVNDSLESNFHWEGELQSFRFSTDDGSDEEIVQAHSLEEAAIQIASRNGWYYEPDPTDVDDDKDNDTAEYLAVPIPDAAVYEMACEARQSYDEDAIQQTEDDGIAEATRQLALQQSELLSAAGFVLRKHTTRVWDGYLHGDRRLSIVQLDDGTCVASLEYERMGGLKVLAGEGLSTAIETLRLLYPTMFHPAE